MFKKLLRIELIAILLVLSLLVTPTLAVTEEVSAQPKLELRSRNFWQEADITFWQTLPFATLFGHLIDRQLSAIMFPGATPHWNAIVAFATVVSAGNALIHARKVTRKEKTD
jgi:hypothetical protein